MADTVMTRKQRRYFILVTLGTAYIAFYMIDWVVRWMRK